MYMYRFATYLHTHRLGDAAGSEFRYIAAVDHVEGISSQKGKVNRQYPLGSGFVHTYIYVYMN